MNATFFNQSNIVVMLVEKGATVNKYDNNGDTALTYAARHDRLEILQYLRNKSVAELRRP